jgi:hypothetical protein
MFALVMIMASGMAFETIAIEMILDITREISITLTSTIAMTEDEIVPRVRMAIADVIMIDESATREIHVVATEIMQGVGAEIEVEIEIETEAHINVTEVGTDDTITLQSAMIEATAVETGEMTNLDINIGNKLYESQVCQKFFPTMMNPPNLANAPLPSDPAYPAYLAALQQYLNLQKQQQERNLQDNVAVRATRSNVGEPMS